MQSGLEYIDSFQFGCWYNNPVHILLPSDYTLVFWAGGLVAVTLLPFLAIQAVYNLMNFSISIVTYTQSFIWDVLKGIGYHKQTQSKLDERAALFATILIRNLVGRLPYGFTWTRRLSFNLGLSSYVRLSAYLWNWYYYKSNIINTRLMENISITLIKSSRIFLEVLSTVRRVFSLAIRLFANRLAGHVRLHRLIHRMYNSISIKQSRFRVIGKNISLLPITRFVIARELTIAVLQSYVFRLLATLYATEAERR